MQRNAFSILVVAVVAIAIGVALFVYVGDPVSDTTPPNTPASPVSFIELASGAQSTETKPVNYLITSKAELAELWKMIDSGDDLIPPTVDFNRYDVVAVFAGSVPTAGYVISVLKVEDGASREVTVLTQKPGASCIAATVITSPYQIVQLPKTTLPMTHIDVEEVISCLR